MGNSLIRHWLMALQRSVLGSAKPTPRPRRLFRPSLEPLENRWTPATLVSPNQVTYRDLDGDIVRVTFSKPILTSPGVADSVFTFSTGSVDGNNVAPQQLREINLTSVPGAKGTSITVALDGEPAAGSDAQAHVGFINAQGRDLGKVVVNGDLGRIRAGDDTLSTPALRALFADSIGVKFINTQAPGGDLASNIKGPVGKIVVAGDIVDASIRIEGDAGRLELLQIGGSLIGGGIPFGGQVVAFKSIGEVRIGGNVVGGAGQQTGLIQAIGRLGNVTIGGSVTGGAGVGSGLVGGTSSVGHVVIGGNVVGGSGRFSGIVATAGNIAAVAISGSLIGGSEISTGSIEGRTIGKVTVGGDVDGRNGGNESGSIQAGRALKRVLIGGNVFGGTGYDSGQIGGPGVVGSVTINGSLVGGDGDRAGWVYSRSSIRSVNIAGLIFGGSVVSEFGNLGSVSVGAIIGFPNKRALISAPGDPNTDTPGIGSLTVIGSVQNADVLAGYRAGVTGPPTRSNANARIGRVSVGGDWVASNLAAGVDRGADGMFGTADDGTTVNGSNDFISRIGPITIGGVLNGTAIPGDSFGIVAERVASLSIGGNPVTLTAGALNDASNVLPTPSNSGDVVLKELQA